MLWTLGLHFRGDSSAGLPGGHSDHGSSTAFYVVFGLLAAVRATGARRPSAGVGMLILPIQSAILPFLLPAGFNSVLWGVGSTPVRHVALTGVLSRGGGVLQQPGLPALQWIKLDTPAARSWAC